jgi:hypothetical protein
MSPGRLQVGVAEEDITPHNPTPLAGFAARNNALFEGVDHSLAIKAFWWSVGDQNALLVVADILWWPPEQIDALRQQIAGRWPVPGEHIILHATHTHSAPHPSRAFTESLGIPDDAWIEMLFSRLIDVVDRAWDARRLATVSRGRGTSGIGIQRRVALGVEPAATAVVDPEVVVLSICDRDHQPMAHLVHYACHPTTTGLPRVSSEFPGVMCELLSADSGPDVVVAFLQGCCGDINPRSFVDRDLREIGDADVVQHGEELAADVRRILASPMEPVNIDAISARREIARLDFRHVPPVEELEAGKDGPGVTGEWSRLLLAYPDRLSGSIDVEVTHLRLGTELAFMAMAAEVTTPYGLAIKTLSNQKTLPLPYSNGMTGYVVTNDQLAQGGYEPIESIPYFGLPSPFADGIEQAFTSAITRSLR